MPEPLVAGRIADCEIVLIRTAISGRVLDHRSYCPGKSDLREAFLINASSSWILLIYEIELLSMTFRLGFRAWNVGCARQRRGSGNSPAVPRGSREKINATKTIILTRRRMTEGLAERSLTESEFNGLTFRRCPKREGLMSLTATFQGWMKDDSQKSIVFAARPR